MTAYVRWAGVASGFHVAPPIAMTSLWRSAGIAIDCAAKSFTSSSCVKSSISQMRGREITQGWLVMRAWAPSTDRKSVVEGKRVLVRVDLGGCRNIKKKENK